MENVFKITAQINVELSRLDIDDIMLAALTGGITYWCRRVEPIGECRARLASERISRGGGLRLYDSESADVYELDLPKFLSGFKAWLESGGDVYGAVDSSGKVDCSNIDADCADAIVQFAVFGELVFG